MFERNFDPTEGVMADDFDSAATKFLQDVSGSQGGWFGLTNAIYHNSDQIDSDWAKLKTILAKDPNRTNDEREAENKLDAVIKDRESFWQNPLTNVSGIGKTKITDGINNLIAAHTAAKSAAANATATQGSSNQQAQDTEDKTVKNNRWDAAKDLARSLGDPTDGPKIAATLSPEIRKILQLDNLKGDQLRSALSRLFSQVPANDSPDWRNKIYGTNPSPQQKNLGVIIQALADKFKDSPDLMNSVSGGAAPTPTGSAPGAPTAQGATKPVDPTAAALQAQLEKSNAVLQQVEAKMGQEEQAINRLGEQVTAANDKVRGLEAAGTFSDLVRSTTHRGFLYNLAPWHLFTHDDPMKNKNFTKLVTQAEGGNTNPAFQQDAVEMYTAIQKKQSLEPSINKMADTLATNEALLQSVEKVDMSANTAQVKKGAPSREQQMIATSGNQPQFLGQTGNADPGVGAMLTQSANWQQAGRQQTVNNNAIPTNGAAAAVVAPPASGATVVINQSAPAAPQNQPAPQ